MRTVKQLIMVLFISMLSLGLTSCDKIDASAINGFEQALDARVEANIKYVEGLRDDGYIGDDIAESITKTAKKNKENILNDLKNLMEGKSVSSSTLQSIVGWSIVPTADHKDKNGSYEHFKQRPVGTNIEKYPNGLYAMHIYKGSNMRYYPCEHDITDNLTSSDDIRNITIAPMCSADICTKPYLTNAIGVAAGADRLLSAGIPAISGGTIKPLVIIDENEVTKLLEDLVNIQVYVLKDYSQNTGSQADTVIPLNEITEAINSGKTEELNKYFKSTGYTLLSGEGAEKLVSTTTPTYADQGTNINLTSMEGNPAAMYCYESGQKTMTGSGNENNPYGGIALGTDLVYYEGQFKMLQLRLQEFNLQALEILESRLGATTDKYLIVEHGGEKRAYLMQYPVYYANNVKELTRTASEIGFERSQLLYNLKTQKYYKSSDTCVDTISAAVPVNEFNGYLDDTSIVIYNDWNEETSQMNNGDCKVTIDYGSGMRAIKVDTGRLILRDYLELTYAPNVVDNEKLVALGRKIRLTLFDNLVRSNNYDYKKFNKVDIIASIYDTSSKDYYRDESGKTIDFYIDDFCDIDSLVSDSPIVDYINRTDLSDPNITTGQMINSKSNKELKDKANAIINLPTRQATTLYWTMPFPNKQGAKNIAIQDAENIYKDDNQLFYGIGVRKDIFQSGLFGTWLSSQDKTENSLDWWNTWLKSHGYNYSINKNVLTSYLTGNYATQLSQEGIVILDLNAINVINKIYEEEDKVETSQTIKSLFNVIGYLLISYAVVLLVAWNVDVNVDVGLGLIQKMTFGNWVAVKDKSEMPILHKYDNSDGTKYVDFKELALSCAGIILLGILLVFLNVTQLVLWLIGLFGGIADAISSLVLGR